MLNKKHRALSLTFHPSTNMSFFLGYLTQTMQVKIGLSETLLLANNLSVLTPLVWGGTIYSNGFFSVQSILADRYMHRREM